jgi:DNA-binding CsgD family transcriptional regulator
VFHAGDACLAIAYHTPRWAVPDCLSCAEARAVKGVLEGRSYDEIAREAGIARRTLANHFASVHRKLGVHSRIELLIALPRQASGVASGPRAP